MKIIGHRGAKGLAPENTVAGLRKGLEHHVDELEFDLRVTKDKIPVLHHDKDLADPAGNRLAIAKHTYKELKAHKPDLATFDEILEVIGRKVPLYVEVKPEVPVKPVVTVIKKHLKKGWKPEDFRLASFSQHTLLELHEQLPQIQKVVLERWSGVRATRRARQLGTKDIIMKRRWLWWGLILMLAGSGYKLGTYTINNPRQAKRWQRFGLKSVVTDFPDRFKKSK